MGTGKSSAAITYMNEHEDQKFIYITPYLSEASRIVQSCKALNFIEPAHHSEFSWSKTLHTLDLVKQGKNIASTHQAFRSYSSDLLDEIKSKEYTLIIDENVVLLEVVDEDPADIQMIIDAGYVQEIGACRYHLVKDVYHGKTHSDLFRLLRSRDIIKTTYEDGNDTFFYWQLPPELITSFKDVFILTYLFDGQDLHHFLEMYSIPYDFTNISFDGKTYRFSDTNKYVPEYVYSISDKIHIEDTESLNSVGDDKYALSVSWFKKTKPGIDKLKNNTSNFFKHRHPVSADKKMWSTFKDAHSKIRGKGYTNAFVNFNEKATNEYRDRNVLVYDVNIFMNVGQKTFYIENGIDVNEDLYALSVMVQWIWRSAIRDGNEIWIYVPSKRMRDMLINWMNSISKGENNYG